MIKNQKFKNKLICSYEEAINMFFSYCKKHGIKQKKGIPKGLDDQEEVCFFKDKKSVKILTDTIRGNYYPYYGPAGHLQLMKEFVNQLI